MTTPAMTTTIGDTVYGYDADGHLMSVTTLPEPKPIAPFWWETHPVNADAAHAATLAMGKGN